MKHQVNEIFYNLKGDIYVIQKAKLNWIRIVTIRIQKINAQSMNIITSNKHLHIGKYC